MSVARADSGFTLVEIVVVLTILGILSGLGFSIFFGSVEIAMDAERRSGSLQSVRVALERFRRDAQSLEGAGESNVSSMARERLRFRARDGAWIEYALDDGAFERDGIPLVENVAALSFTYFARGGAIAWTADELRRIALRIRVQDGELPVELTGEVFLRQAPEYPGWTER